MTAGGDGFAAVAGGPALHIPVLGRPALDFLNVHDGGVYIDATFGAGGYTRAILAAADCKVIGIDRDQHAIALGADLVQAAQRPADADRGSLLQSRRGRARRRLRRGRRRGARSRRLLHAARQRRARLLVPPRRAARHAHGRRRPERGRCGRRGERARSRQHHLHARRGAPFARRRARHRQGARAKRRSVTTARARRYRRLGGALAPGRYPSGHAHVPGAAHLRQRRTGRTGRRARRRRAHPQSRRPPGGGVVPFARGPHRQIVPRRPQRNRAPARATRPSVKRPAPTFRVLTKRPVDRRCRRGRAQPARPLGQAARRRAHRGARAHGRCRPICCRGCRRWPTF